MQYILIHKPKGCLSSTVDSMITDIDRKTGDIKGGDQRLTVYDVVESQGFRCNGAGLVGRLDFNTSGVMLLTNDCPLSLAIRNPDDSPEPNRFKCKIYHATVCMRSHLPLGESTVNELSQPLQFHRSGNEYNTDFAQVELLSSSTQTLANCPIPEQHGVFKITLSEGKHHQIKRMLRRSKLTLVQLHRVCICDILSVDSVAQESSCRHLSVEEVCLLKAGLGIPT